VAKAAESVSLAWTNLGPVTVQSSVDLADWQDAGTFTTSPALFPAGKPVEFFRVVQSPTVTLAWDLDTDHSVTGYRLYSGVASRVYTNSVDAGSALSVTISVVPGVTNYFAVTAYSVAIESLFSNEASDPPRAPWTQIPASISP
jgi:hypothetical protein